MKVGDNIWIYVMGNRPFDVDFEASTIAVTNGIELRPGTDIRHRWGNNWYSGMSYEVRSESRTDGATITITDCYITGQIYPDVEYKVVVSGNAVARNDAIVAEYFLDQADADYVKWLLFDRAPYPVTALSLDTEGTMSTLIPPPADFPEFPQPDPGSSGNQIVEIVQQTLVLNEFSPINQYGARPIVFDVLPGTGYKYGMIHLREFSDFIGAEAVWDNGSSSATITGHTRDGRSLEIQLASGASELTVTIDGASTTTDIAIYSGAPNLAGKYTGQNRDGALYLPFRAVANAYGTTLEWNPLTETVTFFR